MPMPYRYAHATEEWRHFIAAVGEETGIESSNVIYTALQGLLLAFRARATAQETLWFGDALPAVSRAILLAHWTLDEPRRPWASAAEVEAEVRAFRQAHNFAPPGIVAVLIRTVHQTSDQPGFTHAMARLSPEARAFWACAP